jgi:hypothetical protein
MTFNDVVQRPYSIITNLDRMVPPSQDKENPLAQIHEDGAVSLARGDTVKIDTLIDELSLERPELLRSGALTSRHELRTFTEAIQSLQNEPTLVLLSTLMSQASQAARTAHFQSRSIAKDLEVLRTGCGGGADGIINQILAALEGIPKSADQTFRWERLSVDSAVPKYNLIDNSHRPVLEAEKLKSGIAVAWSTFDALEEFCAATSSLKGAFYRESEIGVLVRLYDQVGVRTDKVADIGQLQQSLRRLTDDEKLSLLRLDFGDARVWFNPGDLFTEALDADAVLEPTRIAIHAYRHDSLVAFGAFISATSSYAFNPPEATKLLLQFWDLEHTN